MYSIAFAATVCFLGSNRRKEEEEEDVYVV